MPFDAPDNSPLRVSETNYAPETPRLETVLLQANRTLSLALRVALPGQIVRICAEQTVDVLPLFQTCTFGRQLHNMPVLREVPVAMPQGADWRISFPLAVGDTGLCVFCDRNMDAFLGSDGTSPKDPQDDRAHDLNDAVFFPGLVPQAKQTTDTGQDLVLQNGQATVRLHKNGTVSVQNRTAEAVAVLAAAVQAQADALSALATAVIKTPAGPGAFADSSVAVLQAMQKNVQALHDSLKTFQV